MSLLQLFLGVCIAVMIICGVIVYIVWQYMEKKADEKLKKGEELTEKHKDDVVKAYNEKLKKMGYKKTFTKPKYFSMIFLNEFIKSKKEIPHLMDIFRDKDTLVCGVYNSKLIMDDARYSGVTYWDYKFVDVYEVPINYIEYYATSKNVSYINKIYNEGKNISLSGALVGGIIAGEAGAIIGAGKDKNQLVNKTEKRVDYEGCIVLNRDGKITKYNLVQELADKLEQLCPEKNIEYIQAHANISTQTSGSSKEKLKELKEMYDDGLISEEEYENKRNEILSNM